MAGHTRLLILLLTTFLSSTRPASAQSSLSNSTSACLRALSQSSQFSKFVSFVNEGGLVPGLLDAIANSQGGITVFAPTDGAWNGLSPLSATYLMTPANILVFQSLLFSHAVGQSLQAAQLQNNQTLISLSGEPLLMLRSNGTLQVDRFPISLPDAIITSDCIVHGFNGIIVPLSIPVDAGLVPTTPPVFGGPLPPAPAPAPIPAPAPAPQPGPAPAPAAFPCSTILEAAVNTGRYRQLVQVLQATGLDLAIRTLTIPVTIFAPTDDAFNAIPSTLLVKLGSSSDTLQRILLYHVADGYHAAASLLNRGNVTLSSELQGLPIPIFSPNQTTVVVGPPGSEGVVTEPDLALVDPVCVLHGISTVMIPPGFIFPGAPAPAPAPSQAGIAPAPEISAQNTTSTGTLTVPSATPTPRKGASAELSASFTSACLLSAFGLSLILL